MSLDSPGVSELHPSDRLPEHVSGVLPDAERVEVERHLASCPSCNDEMELLRALRTAPSPSLRQPEVDRLYTPLAAGRTGWWKVGLWRAAAGIVVVLTSYGIWLTARDGREGGEAWSAEQAIAGWEADLTELSPGSVDLRVALGSNGFASWPELEGEDLGLTGWEDVEP